MQALNNDVEDDLIPADAMKSNEGNALKAEALILSAAEHVKKQQK